MAADVPETGFRIVLISLSGRTEGVPVGSYLASYDPRAIMATASQT